MNNHTHNHKRNERLTFLYTETETKFCAQVNDISILALVIIGRHLYYVVEEPAPGASCVHVLRIYFRLVLFRFKPFHLAQIKIHEEGRLRTKMQTCF